MNSFARYAKVSLLRNGARPSTYHNLRPSAWTHTAAYSYRDAILAKFQVLLRYSGMSKFDRPRVDDQTSLPLLSQYDLQNYRAPEGVVVLCHGLFGFDKVGPSNMPWLQVHYWRNIPEALVAIGCKVYVAKVGRVDGLEQRAQQLFDQLNELYPGQEVHLIAHSMGGLDCRYMLSHLVDKQPTKFIAKSLTTICTPHRGTAIMDWFRDSLGIGNHEQLKQMQQLENGSAASFSLQTFVKSVVSLLDAPAFSNLTTDYCVKVLNPKTPDNPRVRYYSYGAARELPFYHTLHIPQQIIKKLEGENDGLVSVQSAKWGQYLGTVPCDHWDLNNRWRAKEVIAPVVDVIPKITSTVATQTKVSVASLVSMASTAATSSPTSSQAAASDAVSEAPCNIGKQVDSSKETQFDCIEFYLKHATFLSQESI